MVRVLAVAVLFVSLAAIAGNLDGNYTFSSRVKEGKADMVGWSGSMSINNNTMVRKYTSPTKEEKFYEGTMKQEGDIYTIKFTKAYKPEYVGAEHKNKITLSGNTLTMEGADGKFKEIWTKK